VKSSGWFEDTKSLFIAMEYLPLGDLGNYMTQLFRENETQEIAFQLLEGLDFMHSNGFVHRDLEATGMFKLYVSILALYFLILLLIMLAPSDIC
jgi:serine/threonine protein kinase